MIEITDRNFDSEVMQCKLPVFVCFVTQWCHSCYPTCLLAKELESKYEYRVKFVKIDVGEIPHVSDRYRINAVPTIMLFQNSQPVKSLLGFQERSSLISLLDILTAGDDPPGARQAARGDRLSGRTWQTGERAINEGASGSD